MDSFALVCTSVHVSDSKCTQLWNWENSLAERRGAPRGAPRSPPGDLPGNLPGRPPECAPGDFPGDPPKDTQGDLPGIPWDPTDCAIENDKIKSTETRKPFINTVAMICLRKRESHFSIP